MQWHPTQHIWPSSVQLGSATAPASRLANCKWEGAKVSRQVASQTRTCLLLLGITVARPVSSYLLCISPLIPSVTRSWLKPETSWWCHWSPCGGDNVPCSFSNVSHEFPGCPPLPHRDGIHVGGIGLCSGILYYILYILYIEKKNCLCFTLYALQYANNALLRFGPMELAWFPYKLYISNKLYYDIIHMVHAATTQHIIIHELLMHVVVFLLNH